nr:MAG TPA: hypothetical protein [Caudoviricetes sp.]
MEKERTTYTLTSVGVIFAFLTTLILGITLGFILQLTVFSPIISQNCNDGIMRTKDGIYETRFCIVNRMETPKEN